MCASAGISVIEAARFQRGRGEAKRGKNRRGGENWGWARQTERTAVGEREEKRSQEGEAEGAGGRERESGGESRKGERAGRGQDERAGSRRRARAAAAAAGARRGLLCSPLSPPWRVEEAEAVLGALPLPLPPATSPGPLALSGLSDARLSRSG